jgi:hypothetical protein
MDNLLSYFRSGLIILGGTILFFVSAVIGSMLVIICILVIEGKITSNDSNTKEVEMVKTVPNNNR